MVFWAITALMALGAALCVIVPLSRKPGKAISQLEHDKALYHARLKEIERDKELGRVSSEEADAAIAEEGRKLIAMANQAGSSPGPAAPNPPYFRHILIMVLSAIFVPAIALAVYLPLGSPQMN